MSNKITLSDPEWINEIPKGYSNILEFRELRNSDFFTGFPDKTVLIGNKLCFAGESKANVGDMYYCLIPETPKQIDWSKLEFSNILFNFYDSRELIVKMDYLKEYSPDQPSFMPMLSKGEHDWYTGCRPLLDHYYSHDGKDCPLPDGIRVTIIRRNGTTHEGSVQNFHWKYDRRLNLDDIISFKIMEELDKGYVW